MPTVRTFIAIDPPPAVVQTVQASIEQLRPQFPARAVRWVQAEQTHLTLRFLGETAVSQLLTLQQRLDAVAEQHAPFRLTLGEFGCFPNCRRPRVLWLGFEGELAQLHGLQQQLEGVVQGLGWAREKRPFSPHLTLGRSKQPQQLRGVRWQAALTEGARAFTVTAVRLVESELTPSGARYTIRHSSRLGGS